MFKHLSLRVKLMLTFLLVAALVGVAGYYEVHAANTLNASFTHLVGHDFVRRDLLDEMQTVIAQAQSDALAYAQSAEDRAADANLLTAQNKLSSLQATFANYLAQYRTLTKDDNEQALARNLPALTVDTDTMFQAAQSLAAAAAPARKPTTQRTSLQQASSKVDKEVGDLIVVQDSIIDVNSRTINESIAQLVQLILLLVAGVIAATTVLAIVVATVLSRSLRRLRDSALRIANGDFSKKVPVTSDDEMGQLARAFNSMSDRLRDSYQRLAAESERDRILLESLGEGIIAIDEHTNVALINDKALALLELPAREKMIGIPVNHTFTLYDEHDHPITADMTPALQALQTSQPASDVFTFHRKSGTKVLVNIAANPVVFNGKTNGAIMTLRDVTKEKEIDRMKTEFISLASHQLRTPLSAIRWFTEMLVSGDAGQLQPEQLEFAKNISDSTERMIALVNALLNISRIESGRIMVDPKPTDLKELVAGIVNDLKGKTAEKQQSLIISVHDDLPKINLDARLIGQVYLNLLSNAVKYTPKGGEIAVFISRKDDQIISQVTDNGYGIPHEQQGRVFQKFFRAANAVKVETDGTGLGLYLIKAVIESSGGKIWFESEENKGTTFWFSIPVSGMKRKEGEVTLDV